MQYFMFLRADQDKVILGNKVQLTLSILYQVE